MKQLIAIVGNNSSPSTNRQLLCYMQDHFKDQAHIELMEIAGLPVFNKPSDKKEPKRVLEMAQKIEAADGVIISTPEYNHTIPSALRNALHWLSYYIYPLVDKPVMITGASYGRLGSSRAQAHLRQILDSNDIRARVMPNLEFMLGYSLQAFDEEGKLVDPAIRQQLDQIFAEYLIFCDLTNDLIQKYGSNKQEAKDFSWDKDKKEQIK